MRFGVIILPQHEWPEAVHYWRGAEELGFDHAWTYDHLSWRGLAGERWHATVPTLTAAAMVTERIGLGTFVASPNFRHPVPFAKEVATLDQISGGRLLLGVGSGGTGFDAFVLGQSECTPRQRLERFVEFAEALDVLLRFEEPESGGISFEGEWFAASGARMVGEPAQRPRMPLHLAAEGPKSLDLVARLGDGWVTTGTTVDDTDAWWQRLAELSARLDDACARQDRDPASLDRILSLDSEPRYSLASAAAFEDAVGRAAELGFTDVVAHWPREHGLYAGDESVLDEVAELMPRLR
ncbi:alkanesulfonate monooxygenase SsuD/methylene tetrahydromethanopterin reductase-like flavin-dependent oxidoreductase (luciferase family) [Agromyces hippuratus]|uniref:Alkanesulfonate monooxygenase SsuD/methylene tetrahydromethanopterin reductase-like flavin-dependent oxidoreductase (Luciferase family) n=1 Tax=Agromyces hippuratus TaxID=286438 RepID=A0A852WT55_9MICO|nr:LLM class flavin-dependent oxidoreductase [Agromyces hippuratus]NYG19500.1 alkanesulfonate monooxygenase SsuD/methylene tetrahydromethanopterin reductase-like flavin-dependent oxidoreductase (luciferase family) [Agromyces hippuratus]